MGNTPEGSKTQALLYPKDNAWEDKQTSLPGLRAQVALLAGQGLKWGSHVPAPPVPSHTGLLLLQHKTGDLQHVEEGHAHDVRDGVTLAPQALLKPAPRASIQVPGPQKASWNLLEPTLPDGHSLARASVCPTCTEGGQKKVLQLLTFRTLWVPSAYTQEPGNLVLSLSPRPFLTAANLASQSQ